MIAAAFKLFPPNSETRAPLTAITLLISFWVILSHIEAHSVNEIAQPESSIKVMYFRIF